MQSSTAILMVGFLMMPLALAPASVGHGGSYCPTGATTRLEAECYTFPDAACDPDGDGEHTTPVPQVGSSGGAHVFLPHSGCGVNFFGTFFTWASTVHRFCVRVGGSGATVGVTIDVYSEGLFLATGSVTTNAASGWTCGNLSLGVGTGGLIGPTLRITSTINGPGFMNTDLDFIEGLQVHA